LVRRRFEVWTAEAVFCKGFDCRDMQVIAASG
jgi:hypothetical protein